MKLWLTDIRPTPYHHPRCVRRHPVTTMMTETTPLLHQPPVPLPTTMMTLPDTNWTGNYVYLQCKQVKVKVVYIAVNGTPSHSYGVSLTCHNEITRCYLPPDTSEHALP